MFRNRPPSDQARKVLQALASRPADWRHGYDLAKATGLSSGTLYPLLIRLHERELLEAKWEQPDTPGKPPRHAYRLTATGVALAHQTAGEVQSTSGFGKAITA